MPRLQRRDGYNRPDGCNRPAGDEMAMPRLRNVHFSLTTWIMQSKRKTVSKHANVTNGVFVGESHEVRVRPGEEQLLAPHTCNLN